MDLAFGRNVREHFYSIGRLAGLEADRSTHAVCNIVISAAGAADDATMKRPFAAVQVEHMDGDLELRSLPNTASPAALDRAIVLTSQTRLMREGHSLGHLLGVEIDPDSHEIVAVIGRHHWWAPKLHLKAETLDFSVPGEIRVH